MWIVLRLMRVEEKLRKTKVNKRSDTGMDNFMMMYMMMQQERMATEEALAQKELEQQEARAQKEASKAAKAPCLQLQLQLAAWSSVPL